MHECREPGCAEVYEQRPTRNAHEDRCHPYSSARVWVCPRGCGPMGSKYTAAGLRGHMRRSHQMSAAEIDAAWPQVNAKRLELTGETMPETAPGEPDAEAVVPDADVIAKQLGIFLHQWDETREKLADADARIADLAEQVETLTAERDRGWAALARIRERVEAEAKGAGTGMAGATG